MTRSGLAIVFGSAAGTKGKGQADEEGSELRAQTKAPGLSGVVKVGAICFRGEQLGRRFPEKGRMSACRCRRHRERLSAAGSVCWRWTMRAMSDWRVSRKEVFEMWPKG